MKMKKSFLLIAVSALFLIAFLAGCSSDDESSGSSKDGDKIKLEVVSQYGGTDPATEVFQGLLDEFEKENPNITIENNSGTASTEFNTKLQTRWSSGDIPDLTFFFGDSKGEFIKESGKVVDMQQILDENPDWAADFNTSVLDGVKKLQDGKLYTIPVNGYYEGLIVNKKMFDDAGLELPKTWDQFEKAIKTFAKNDIIPIAASLPDSYYLIENFIFAQGGVEGHSDPFSPSYAEGLNLIKDTYEWNAYPKDALTIGDADAQNYFKKGQAAMIINGSWVVGGVPDEIAENTTVLPMPVPPNGKMQYGSAISGFSSGWYLNKETYGDSKKKDAAIKLLKYVTSKDAIKSIAQAQGSVPSVKDVTIEGTNPATTAGLEMASNAEKLEPAADGFISAEAYDYIRTHVPQIVTGKESAKDVLKDAKKLNK